MMMRAVGGLGRLSLVSAVGAAAPLAASSSAAPWMGLAEDGSKLSGAGGSSAEGLSLGGWSCWTSLRIGLCRGFAAQSKHEVNGKETRINGAIQSPRVRLVGSSGHEVIDTAEALRIAREAGMDLVEVGASGGYPVVKVMDHAKVQFEQKKKVKETKKLKLVTRRMGEQKEVQLRPQVAAHDLEVKLTQARRHMEKGYKVRFVVNLRFPNERSAGQAVLDKVKEQMAPVAKLLDNARKPHPRLMDLTMMPLPETIKTPEKDAE